MAWLKRIYLFIGAFIGLFQESHSSDTKPFDGCADILCGLQSRRVPAFRELNEEEIEQEVFNLRLAYYSWKKSEDYQTRKRLLEIMRSTVELLDANEYIDGDITIIASAIDCYICQHGDGDDEEDAVERHDEGPAIDPEENDVENPFENLMNPYIEPYDPNSSPPSFEGPLWGPPRGIGGIELIGPGDFGGPGGFGGQ